MFSQLKTIQFFSGVTVRDNFVESEDTNIDLCGIFEHCFIEKEAASYCTVSNELEEIDIHNWRRKSHKIPNELNVDIMQFPSGSHKPLLPQSD